MRYKIFQIIIIIVFIDNLDNLDNLSQRSLLKIILCINQVRNFIREIAGEIFNFLSLFLIF